MGMLVRPDTQPPQYGCKGKTRYRSLEAAQDGLIRLRERIRDGTDHVKARRESPDRPLEVYQCAWCFGWHVGHRPKKAAVRKTV